VQSATHSAVILCLCSSVTKGVKYYQTYYLLVALVSPTVPLNSASGKLRSPYYRPDWTWLLNPLGEFRHEPTDRASYHFKNYNFPYGQFVVSRWFLVFADVRQQSSANQRLTRPTCMKTDEYEYSYQLIFTRLCPNNTRRQVIGFASLRTLGEQIHFVWLKTVSVIIRNVITPPRMSCFCLCMFICLPLLTVDEFSCIFGGGTCD